MTGVFVDAIDTYGHFIELYEWVPRLRNMHDLVEEAAKNFDGNGLIRSAID